ncbi:CDP-diacylglycerol--inositol 3-phosphatidyltransferase 1 [Citrus sinensis]|uniref:CDP-diacylglycerol--inositol 3-phosphatidyltransferase 1 n=1 Tax=Citrus sinensis TaxID=2711 RepID=A0ACB8HY48_CITSI|nr:CDP-diacylglycerol--inositol 3-phosphatidyltransferase 1 [Citrus sinensis]
MVTDTISTSCILVILSQLYMPGLVFVSLLALDIGSHWLQMYRKVLLSLGNMPTPLDLCCRTFLTGKTSHKDVKDSTNWLFKAYYGNRMFMGYCSVTCEVLYLILFLIAEKQSESLVDVVVSAVHQGSPLSFLVALSLFGWATRQMINVIQMKTAADVCALYDIEKKQKP